jgi:hypothetical protein
MPLQRLFLMTSNDKSITSAVAAYRLSATIKVRSRNPEMTHVTAIVPQQTSITVSPKIPPHSIQNCCELDFAVPAAMDVQTGDPMLLYLIPVPGQGDAPCRIVSLRSGQEYWDEACIRHRLAGLQHRGAGVLQFLSAVGSAAAVSYICVTNDLPTWKIVAFAIASYIFTFVITGFALGRVTPPPVSEAELTETIGILRSVDAAQAKFESARPSEARPR